MTAPFEQGKLFHRARHGFFGRLGGVSKGPFHSNNVSVSVGDDLQAVEHNRASVSEALGFRRGDLQILKQVHSANVWVLTGPLEETVEADAMVTAETGLLLGILTADCTPILLADQEAGVIGAAHAGWRGAASGVAEATVGAMARLGADPERIVAAIGPTISGANYEVGPQFAGELLRLYPDAGSRIFVPESGVEHFDLPGFVEDRLRSVGVEQIERVGGCTYAEPERYFSHRYATHQGTKTGRQIALIGLS